MNKKYREWLANKLELWSERLQEWSDRVRPAPLEQYGPLTHLQMIMREALTNMLKSQNLASQLMWPQGFPPPGKYEVGETLRIRLPQDSEL